MNGIFEISGLPSFTGNVAFNYQLFGTNGALGLGSSSVTAYPAANGEGGKGYYFADSRRQMKENLKFLLRSATVTLPFGYTSDRLTDGSSALSPDSDFIWQPETYFARPAGSTSYEYYGFHYFSSNQNYSLIDELRPVHENLLWRNFVFDLADYDRTGADYIWDSGLFLRSVADPAHWFSGSGTETNVILAFTNNSSSAFLYRYLAPGDADFDDAAAEIGLRYVTNSGIVLSNSVRNVFGLPLTELVTDYEEVVTPGGTVTFPTANYFVSFANPVFQVTNYYFASETPHFRYGVTRPPVPGSPDFSVTNASRLLITGVGQPITVGGWAKMAITNGYAGKFAYLEQYFDEAYLLDSAGAMTTNQTGLLSPYGEFFPTEPGQVALTTMPDIDTGQTGSVVVSVIKLQLDVNHDGDMDLSYGGPDNTSEGRPFVFWVNDDFDRVVVSATDLEDDVLSGRCPWTNAPTPDCEYRDSISAPRIIPCARDLEDFARLWICGISTNFFASLPPGVTAELSWGDKGNLDTNNPTIDIFGAAEQNGIGYLTNYFTQSHQIGSSYIGERLGPGESVSVVSSSGFWSRAIWCGVKAGSGKLTLTFYQGTNKIAETSAYIEIKDIKRMYERWSVGDAPRADVEPETRPYLVREGLSKGSVAFQYSPAVDTNTPYILQVHDYDLPGWKKDRYAETAFKRLYWQGYKGRFGLFRWPGVYMNTVRPFDDSEFNAWRSASGLLTLLTNLNVQYPGHVHLIAHGYGAIVAGEALRLAGTNKLVNRYIAMQGAVPARAYDPSAPVRSLNGDNGTPDRYLSYYTNGAPPYFWGVGGAETYINYYNTNDNFLTRDWRKTEDEKPDFQYHWNGTNFSFGLISPYTLLLFPADTYEIFSYADEARCEAIGAQPGIGGPFFGKPNLDLSTLPFPLTGVYQEHDGQFKSTSADDWPFWKAVLTSLGL